LKVSGSAYKSGRPTGQSHPDGIMDQITDSTKLYRVAWGRAVAP